MKNTEMNSRPCVHTHGLSALVQPKPTWVAEAVYYYTGEVVVAVVESHAYTSTAKCKNTCFLSTQAFLFVFLKLWSTTNSYFFHHFLMLPAWKQRSNKHVGLTRRGVIMALNTDYWIQTTEPQRFWSTSNLKADESDDSSSSSIINTQAFIKV